MITELERAKNNYANISKRMREPGLSGKEIGFLKSTLVKAKEILKQAHCEAADLTNAVPIIPQSLGRVQVASCDAQAEPNAEPIATPSHSPFHFYAVPGSQQAAVLVDRAYAQWLKFHTFKRAQSTTRLQEYRQIIEGVIANLLYALAMQRPGVFVTREQSTLAKESRYRPGVYNQTLLTVLDDLHAMGLIEQTKGERWKKDRAAQFGFKVRARSHGEEGFCNRTRLQPTKSLNELRSTYHTTRLTDVLFLTDQQEVVILKKDESSALLEYTDEAQPQAVKYRRQMQIINRRLADAGDLLAEEDGSIDQRQRFLVRKFTYSSLESGGRLWGGFWQNMPKVERPGKLRINRQPTVELDYASVIAHLAYIVAGEEAPAGDLYHIPGLRSESRPAMKKLIPALLFKGEVATRYPKGVRELLHEEDQSKSFTQVLELIKARHPGIVHLFGTGEGHFLQYLESQLMVNVLLYCDHAKLVALPIHDCIIVARDQEFIGRSMMELASLRVLGKVIPVKKT